MKIRVADLRQVVNYLWRECILRRWKELIWNHQPKWGHRGSIKKRLDRTLLLHRFITSVLCSFLPPKMTLIKNFNKILKVLITDPYHSVSLVFYIKVHYHSRNVYSTFYTWLFRLNSWLSIYQTGWNLLVKGMVMYIKIFRKPEWWEPSGLLVFLSRNWYHM